MAASKSRFAWPARRAWDSGKAAKTDTTTTAGTWRRAGWLLIGCLHLGAPLASAATYSVVIAGLGGDADYEAQFQRHAKHTAERFSAAAHQVTLLLGEMAARDRVERELGDVAGAMRPSDAFTLTFIGHGSFDRDTFKFNVPGKDFSAAELGAWLTAVPSRRQLIVIASASSGAAREQLTTAERTIVTATRNGNERIAPVFASYFVEALDAEAADVDKDLRLTNGEVFDFTHAAVVQHYADGDRLATEHAEMIGSERKLVLARLAAEPDYGPSSSPLVARRDELAAAVEALSAAKAEWDEQAYLAELQRLLLELAVIENQLEQLEDAP